MVAAAPMSWLDPQKVDRNRRRAAAHRIVEVHRMALPRGAQETVPIEVGSQPLMAPHAQIERAQPAAPR